MSKKLNIYLIGALLVMGLLLKLQCSRNREYSEIIRKNKELLVNATKQISKQEFINSGLKAKIELIHNQMKIVERFVTVIDTINDTTIIISETYVPRESGVEIIIDTLGNVSYKLKFKGFCLEPCICVGISKALVVGLNFRVLYWNRWGATGGVSYGLKNKDWGLPLEIGYRLDKIKWLGNCRIGAGWDIARKTGTVSFGIFL